MGLLDHAVVDIVAHNESTGAVILAIADSEDWSDHGVHLLNLPKKLNSYLAFIEGGDLYDPRHNGIGQRLPPTTPVEIQLWLAMRAPEEAQSFFDQVKRLLARAGIGFSIVYPDDAE